LGLIIIFVAPRRPRSSRNGREGALRQPRLHQAHRRIQSRRIRIPAQVPIRSHCQRRRLPDSRHLQAWHCRCLGRFNFFSIVT
jgi:hypothetical protein